MPRSVHAASSRRSSVNLHHGPPPARTRPYRPRFPVPRSMTGVMVIWRLGLDRCRSPSLPHRPVAMLPSGYCRLASPAATTRRRRGASVRQLHREQSCTESEVCRPVYEPSQNASVWPVARTGPSAQPTDTSRSGRRKPHVRTSVMPVDCLAAVWPTRNGHANNCRSRRTQGVRPLNIIRII